jgi:hypothetical protein
MNILNRIEKLEDQYCENSKAIKDLSSGLPFTISEALNALETTTVFTNETTIVVPMGSFVNPTASVFIGTAPTYTKVDPNVVLDSVASTATIYFSGPQTGIIVLRDLN